MSSITITETDSSLTTPEDRDPSHLSSFVPDHPELTVEETKQAKKAKVAKKTYPQLERRFRDPDIPGQSIGLFSFIPSYGATPDKNGIYGFAKIRGVFPDEDQADKRAVHLIKTVDSYHPIKFATVGSPFPVTEETKFSKDVLDVDLKKEFAEIVNADIKKKRDKEYKDMEEIKQREKNLLEDTKSEESPQDRYTTLRVKKAQLVWTYSETEKKLKQMATSIAKSRREIEELEEKDASLRQTYFDRYMKAREDSGLPVNDQNSQQNFMRYLVEDLVLPAVEQEYQDLYGEQDTHTTSSQ